jgi:serine phosphatase RsbU (regulator of sigma subunit)
MAGILGTERGVSGSRAFLSPLLLTVAFLLVVVVALIAAGVYVRSVVGSSFHEVEAIRSARVHVAGMLKQQLDEETAVRGYAAVRLPILLSSYYGGRANLPLYFDRVGSDLASLNLRPELPTLNDAIRTNKRWLHQVAFPLITTHRNRRPLELHGKTLVDRFRIDSASIDTALARLATAANAGAQEAVLLVGAFAAAAIVAIVLAAITFSVQQFRLALRLERQRVASEAERRRSAEMRAAYETEKRIADVMQEAFSQRVFPDLPAVRLSATYVPATEEAKIGGDWYDAFELPRERVLLAIGDVTGHGIEAVVAMNKARQVIIGGALLDATPDSVLGHANFELVRARSPIITAVAAIIDTTTLEFWYATAGHPPPVLLEPGRRARLLDFGSLPLGVAAKTKYRTHRVQTVPGAMIVLYTDGAIEHSRNINVGEAELLEAVEAAAQQPMDRAANVIHDTIFTRRKVADDVAILTATFSAAMRRSA